MSETVGRGVIELSADATKLNAAINDARLSIKSLGDSTATSNQRAAASIDRYVKGLQTSAAVQGRTTRETELYKLALRGATDEQLRAANSALKLSEAYQRGEVIGGRVRIGLLAIAAASVAAGAASIALFNASAKSIDGFNDLKDATGASIENISALDDLARRTGATFATVETSLIKFNAALKDAKPDSDAALAFEALGLSFKELRDLDPAEAFRRTAVALAGFADDGNKARLVQELFGKSLKEVAPLLKDLSEKGQLVATVTTSQAEAAETYRKNIFALEANIGNLARSLTNDLIPALNKAFTNAQQFSTIGNFFASFGQEIKANLASDKLRVVTADIEALQKTIDRQGGDPLITKKMAALRAEATGLIRDAASASEELKRLSGGPPVQTVADDSQNKAESARLARVPKPSVAIREKKVGGGGGGGGGGGSGIDQAAREAEQIRRAELDADLRFLRDKLGEERATIAFNERERQALYQAGNASLREFYVQRNGEIARGVQTELNLLTDEQAWLEVELKDVKDPSEQRRLQTQLDESVRQSGNVAVEARRAARLATLDEDAALKQLNDTVTDYRANLLLMQGDEEGAAALRTKQVIEQAKVLAKQSGGQISADDVAALGRAEQQTQQINAAKNASSVINERLQMQEERIALAQKAGAITEIAALQQIGAARAGSIAAAEAQVQALEKLAAERPFDIRVNLDLERAKLDLDTLKESLDPLKDKFDEVFRQSGAGAIADFLDGTKSAKEALKDFGRSILSSINATVAKQASEQLFGKDGVFGGAGGLVSSLFGGGAAKGPAQAAGAPNPVDGIGGFVSSLFSGGAAKGPAQAASGLLGAPTPVVDTSGIAASFASLQSAGITPTIDAFARLQQAADGAAGAVASRRGDVASVAGAGTTGEQSIADLFREPADQSVNLSTALADTRKSTLDYSAATAQAASTIASLAGAGSSASTVLGLLPSIINAISAASATTSSAGGGSGWISTIFSLAASAYGGGSGMATNTTGTSLPTSGGRALGGPVGAGEIYRVNEAGPELLAVGGKQYLMMGDQAGVVIPNDKALAPQADIASRAMGGPVAAVHSDRVNGERGPEMLVVSGKQYLMALAPQADIASVPHAVSPVIGGSGRVDGARAMGGPVSSGGMYRVTERGPEVLNVDGKQFLMMGSQPGYVTPNSGGTGQTEQRPINVSNNFTINGPSDRRSEQQIAAAAGGAVQRAMKRGR